MPATSCAYQSVGYALAQLVRDNPSVGKTICYLRIEGGIGKDLHTIAQNAPNVQTLYASMHVRSSNGVAGLRKALPALDPASVYIHHSSSIRSSKAMWEAERLVQLAINSAWTHVVSGVRYNLI
jgi:hypothetical protein